MRGPDVRPLALVTGASGGLGLDMARILAERGWDLVLSARSADVLEAVGKELESGYGIRAEVAARDLAHPTGVDGLLADVAGLGRPLDLLVNNAGIGIHGPYLETDPGAEADMIRLNVEALVRLTRALAPAMVARGRGRILNVGSTAGFLPGPLMTSYYATKAFVLSYSDALAHELDGTGVTVTCLCPGPTPTGFQARAGVASYGPLGAAAMPSRRVAEAGIDGAMAGRRRVVPGWLNKVTTLAPRLFPRDVVTAAVARIQHARRRQAEDGDAG